ncbi:uncharacterized protein [Henckelia pumila]|uniref:uncharacterized protein n=1 Tax=Henckelia pumila TaxID=405737 RepID=UPI003C6E6203
MRISDADQVICAIYTLKDEAALWWESAVTGLDLARMTWRDFKMALFEKYIKEDVRGQLIRDFMSLRQGDRTAVEYVSQFEHGCHFVPMIAGDEKERLWHFTDGLRSEIKHDVSIADVMTYKETVNRAYRSEKGRKEMQADF